MHLPHDDARLSRIQTQWTLVLGSSQAQTDSAGRSLLRYYGAAYRYLLGMVRDPAAAEELAQDFAVRFVRGDFRSANPERGRFRDFLKTALRNQVRDYWRKDSRRKEEAGLPEELAAEKLDLDQDDEAFLAGWREELLARTWDALEEYERLTCKPYFSILRLKTLEPDLRSSDLAERLRRDDAKSYTPEAVRQVLHRAREQFADLLLDEALASLPTRDLDRLEEELVELRLLDYCKAALGRRQLR